MLLTFNTQVKKLLDCHRKCLSFRMQFEDVTLPPTLIYICVSYQCISIFLISMKKERKHKNFSYFRYILSYLTNLLVCKIKLLHYISHIHLIASNIFVLCSSHWTLMDCTALALGLVVAGSQFSLRTRTCTCTETLCLCFQTHTHRCQRIDNSSKESNTVSYSTGNDYWCLNFVL
jgi:hypothetical protein